MRQAEQGLAAAVNEAGSLLDTASVIRCWLQTQLQDSQVVLLLSSPCVAHFQQNLQAIVWLTCCNHLLHTHHLLLFYPAAEC